MTAKQRSAVSLMESAAYNALRRMARLIDQDSNFNMALRLRLTGMPYRKIGKELGISGQRVQQILRPDPGVSQVIRERAQEACESCHKMVGRSGHIHHLTTAVTTPPAYYRRNADRLNAYHAEWTRQKKQRIFGAAS